MKALIRSVGLHAIKGNIAAQKQYINAIIAAEKSSSSNQDEYDLSNLTEAEAMALRDLLLKAKSKNKQKEN